MSIDSAALPQPEPAPLPQREEAERCASVESGRRCVLPPAHPGAHVYPPAGTAL
ncbi:hypothetical protein ACGF0J_25785 [Nonomuraea sp. NPDC047897]|uniref:hypothetical protein n=1 Tax=Nonomuraea sp. NPDC047897 TaxID=3364346 RepID=UPI00372309CC